MVIESEDRGSVRRGITANPFKDRRSELDGETEDVDFGFVPSKKLTITPNPFGFGK